ncbi:rubredoxin [Methanofollis fontis]|uniref:Rubredoxin n=1 Tax=Methanofollis fontis TaxID=2052832 RepID=A0A483CNH1_9EURY|nr:rubredoxin [Methanofollis fontis]TAJ44540.1 rubredoxin [Methanofollis fontis]
MEKYRCMICGHVYDPAKGEPKQNIPPETDFADIPDDWTCPVCGASRDKFRAVA